MQRQLGIATVFVTHDQGEALAIWARIAVMREGRVEQIGSPGDIYERPATRFVAGFIGTANLISEPQGALVIRRTSETARAWGEPSDVRCWPATVERVVYLGPRLERAPARQ